MGENMKNILDTLAEKLPEFDKGKGLSFCAGSEELLCELLGDYTDTTRADDMEMYMLDEDWDNYRIEAHSLKSTSLTVGFTSLSEEAKGLEFAARDGDIDYIEDNHIKVMLHYKRVLMGIQEILCKQ